MSKLIIALFCFLVVNCASNYRLVYKAESENCRYKLIACLYFNSPYVLVKFYSKDTLNCQNYSIIEAKGEISYYGDKNKNVISTINLNDTLPFQSDYNYDRELSINANKIDIGCRANIIKFNINDKLIIKSIDSIICNLRLTFKDIKSDIRNYEYKGKMTKSNENYLY